MTALDDAIMEEYVSFQTPADRLVSNPAVAAAFAAAVNARLKKDQRVDQVTLNKRLLNLRRRGEDNGGLPRLERSYYGRGPIRPR